jgi:lipoprotein NlpI
MDSKAMYETKIPSTMTQLISVFLMLALAGCAMNRNQKAVEMERLLTASGFQMRLADNESQLAQIEELPQRKLVAQNWGGKVRYVYADASNCKCAYVGD